MLDYLLSKRTDVYLSANYDKANGGARAVLAVTLPDLGQRQTACCVRVGIRHKF